MEPTSLAAAIVTTVARMKPTVDAEAEDRREAADKGRKAVLHLARQLGRRYSPQLATLDRFVDYEPRIRAVVARLRVIAQHVRAFVGEGRGLILVGRPGTGKDHLLDAVLYAAAQDGIESRALLGSALYGRFYDAIRLQLPDEPIVADFAGPPILAVSDFLPPKGEPSNYSLDKLLRVVHERYRNLAPTWGTLNVANATEANTALTGPIWRRLSDGAEVLFCDWPPFAHSRFQS